jgi:hypothetical protein
VNPKKSEGARSEGEDENRNEWARSEVNRKGRSAKKGGERSEGEEGKKKKKSGRRARSEAS